MKSLSPWLFLRVPLFFISVGLLVMTVRSLLRTLRDAVVASVPLESAPAVDLREEGHTISTSRAVREPWTLPGQYMLRVRGRGIDRPHDPDDRLVLSRPVRGAMILHILGLVLLGASTVGSMVGSALLMVFPGL
jgi:hypothetical protein